MNKKILVLTLTFVLLCSVIPLAIIPVNAADVTTSVTVTKLANDGTTVLDQVTVTVEEMMADSAELPVYGDGVTHYYFQGPSFDPDAPWDETELVNVDSRDYGACMGNDVKDLCELLPSGGASPGDKIRIKAVDNFRKDFFYDDVYNPEPEQGKLVVTWYTADTAEGASGSVTDGNYSTGMRLIFFAETLNPDGKHVFGTWDMHEYLPEECWHYYYDGATLWPSSSGLSVKWVSDIIIYSSEEPTPPEPEPWTLTLNGAFTYNMSQELFENSVNCHPANWTDDDTLWEGIPLWRFVGFVDDDVQHGEGAFNDAKAAAGYEVKVIASDGYSKTFASADVARNDDMIIANTMNGAELPEDRYPLRLVGPDLTSGQKVSMIQEIQLIGLPKEDASSSLNATANVVIDMVGIDLDRDSIDYGDVMPGSSSAVEPVLVTNIGTLDCDVTLEVVGADATAQSFYAQSLYIDGGIYDIEAVIASIMVAGSEDVDTQLQVPVSWTEATGAQEATFIFWATASD
jgi:DMSO/TMAO reductase YedYZ molybdopterin-dependent catalytic subunit